jgi:hypothetical protein
MPPFLRLFTALAFLAQAVFGAIPAQAAATLLPNGQQCFAATTASSGGNAGIITVLGAIGSGGSGYVTGGYANVPLTGGSGSGATANITVTGGVVTAVTLINPGFHYVTGDNLSAANTSLGGSGSGFSIPVNAIQGTGTGMVGLLGSITGGSLYTNGSYGGVALTGGMGSGATANITVSGGAVTSVTILNPGTQYIVGDVLSATAASIGGTGSGFSVPVSSIAINSSLAGGTVGFFIPGTNTFKQTWQNATQTILNANPVQLNANGCAIIYGTGSYRQVLQDSLGNTVWDQLTTDTSANNNIFWAGVAGGTPNVITLVDPGFNATDGSIINFTALATNTAATTINPSSFGAIAVLKDTTSGPVGLIGGEIIATNPISMVYRATDNAFHLLNTAIASASGANAPLCGASGLKITNGGTPNSVIAVTATQAALQTNAGLTINRSNVSLTAINITTGTGTAAANGMDGEAPGTSAWLDIFIIDNGAAPAGLVSLAAGNGKAPVMPSGYTYKCYVGAMRVDGSGNLLRTLQLGNEAQYQVQAAGALPIITSTFGTYWTSQSVSTFVPPTATRISAAAEFNISVSSTAVPWNGSASIGVAPNGSYAQPNQTGRPPCSSIFASNAAGSGVTVTNSPVLTAMVCNFELESTNIFTGSLVLTNSSATVTATGVLSALGWRDAVNAN